MIFHTRTGCPVPGYRSSRHDKYETHIRCACGWVGIAHVRHVASIYAVRRGRTQPVRDRENHRIVARQRLRRTLEVAS